MRKIALILSVSCLSIFLFACGNNSSDTLKSVDIVGSWTQIDADGDSYLVLELLNDGSGSLITEPEDIGSPLNYELDGTSIVAHVGSSDDNTQMEYLIDCDQIQYGDILFERK